MKHAPGCLRNKVTSKYWRDHTKTAGNTSFLDKLVAAQLVMEILAFMEPEGPSQCPRNPTIRTYLEPVQSRPYHQILFLQDPF